MVQTSDQELIIQGGLDSSNEVYNQLWKYNISFNHFYIYYFNNKIILENNTWTNILANINISRAFHCAGMNSLNWLFIYGGEVNNNNVLANSSLFVFGK